MKFNNPQEPPYDAVNDSLEKSRFKDITLFYNLGYLPNGNKSQAKFDLPIFLFNKNSVRLVLEVIGDIDLNNKTILDIGCGRGGTIQVINKYFKPSRTVGIDISKSSIDYCNNSYPNVTFYVQDAAKNNLDDKVFDVAIIIELKNTEPDIFPVYQETHRVLRNNGVLIQAGIFPRKYYQETLETLSNLYTIISNTDITSNVILSATTNACKRSKHLSGILSDMKTVEDFLITPNHVTFKLLEEKQADYRIITMRKKN